MENGLISTLRFDPEKYSIRPCDRLTMVMVHADQILKGKMGNDFKCYKYKLTSGGSQTHSPVVRLAYMCSLVRGSMISTHSTLLRDIHRREKSREKQNTFTLEGISISLFFLGKTKKSCKNRSSISVFSLKGPPASAPLFSG